MAGCFQVRRLRVTGSLLLAFSSFAGEVHIRIEPQLISLLDRAVMTVEFIDTKANRIEFPPIDGLLIQYQGQRSETRIVNFKSSSKVIHRYLITPKRSGDFTIGPVTAAFKGGRKKLQAALRVIKPVGDQEVQQIEKRLYARVESENQEPYVQEPFPIKLHIFVLDGVQTDGRISISGGLPESGLDGDLKWKIDAQTQREINGLLFNVTTLSATVKTLTAGTFTFQPQVQVNLIVPRQNRRFYGFSDKFFGDLFGRQESRPIMLDCNRLAVAVQPVPLQGRPVDFTGGVGVLDFKVEVGPQSVQVGEPITIRMQISGEGNLDKIIPPAWATNTAYKLYDVHAVEAEQPGTIEFEQVLIPVTAALTNLPSISFSYFNTLSHDFLTLKHGPFPVTIKQTAQPSALIVSSTPGAHRAGTHLVGRDIVHLKPMPTTWKNQPPGGRIFSPQTIALIGTPPTLLALTALLLARRNARTNHTVRRRRQRAHRQASAQLQRARKYLKKKEPALFYEALWKAITAYFSQRLNLAPGEISAACVKRHFPHRAEPIEALFQAVEYRRFGTAEKGRPAEMKKLLHEIVDLLKQCERSDR